MNKYVSRGLAAVGVSGLAAGSAMAEVPAAITTAIGTLGADGASIATTVLIAIVAVFAIKFLRKGF